MIARVIKKEQVAKDIYTFTFQLFEPFTYVPGQYVTISLLDYVKKRPFSILQYIPSDNQLLLCIKENTDVTKKMIARDIPFDMQVSSARGRFLLNKDSIPAIMIAGGVGIVPIYNMIINNTFSQKKMTLFYSCKSPELMAMKNELEEINDLVFIKRFTATEKRFSLSEIKEQVLDFQKSEFYLCGSLDFVNSFKSLIANEGISLEQIKTEIF